MELPVSKSILNRELILSGIQRQIVDLGEMSAFPDDCQLMVHALSGKAMQVDVGHAGTAMRFLTAFFASQPGRRILIGSERMHQRPIHILVDALREVGADITYLGKEGCPPLEINGTGLNGGKVSVSGEVSSQFISALLLCAPRFEEGLELELVPPITSRPYIGLTLAALTRAGIRHQMEGNTITIPPQKAKDFKLSMERDWSAAAYGYGLVALGCCEELLFPGLTVKTWQGDSILGQLFAMLGVQTGESELGVHLIRKSGPPSSFSRDMSECPDLAQPLAFTCAALGVECDLWGLHTLPMKETDRIKAMVECLSQVGIQAEHGTDFIRFRGKISASSPPHFKTYKDHRMAMSLALWTPVLGQISLEDASVVSKSYPQFWIEMEKLGVNLKT